MKNIYETKIPCAGTKCNACDLLNILITAHNNITFEDAQTNDEYLKQLGKAALGVIHSAYGISCKLSNKKNDAEK